MKNQPLTPDTIVYICDVYEQYHGAIGVIKSTASISTGVNADYRNTSYWVDITKCSDASAIGISNIYFHDELTALDFTPSSINFHTMVELLKTGDLAPLAWDWK